MDMVGCLLKNCMIVRRLNFRRTKAPPILSPGFLQRPEVLILDEPTAGLIRADGTKSDEISAV